MKVVSTWQAAELPIELKTFDAATVTDPSHIHSRDYVKGVLAGEIAKGHGNTNRSVAKSCLFTVGSFMAAAGDAARNGRGAWQVTLSHPPA